MSEKSKNLEAFLLDEIRTGHWHVGDRLPSEADLCERLSISQTTLRIALKTLSNRGIIRRVQRKGSFVARDIRKNKILIAVNFEVLSHGTNYYYRTLIEHLQRLLRGAGYVPKLQVGTGIGYEEFCEGLHLEQYSELDELCGVIVLAATSKALQCFLESRGIFVISITSKPYGDYPDLPGNHIYLDCEHILSQGLERLLRYGIRDFAILAINNKRGADPENIEELAHIQRQLQSHGVSLAPENIMIVPWSWERCGVREIFLDWLRMPHRPRVLFCLEDLLCKSVLDVVWEQGLRIPEDFGILTHSNGEAFHTPVPLHCLTFDLKRVSEAACQMFLQIQDHACAEHVSPVLIPSEYEAGQSLTIVQDSPSSAQSFAIRSCCLRKPLQSASSGCWKRCAGYRFVSGMEMFAVDCDIAGQDYYVNYRGGQADDNGSYFHDFQPLFPELEASSGYTYCISELQQQLERNTNSIFRLYLRGMCPAEDAVRRSPGLSLYRLYCSRSFDGGRTFGTEEDLTQIYQNVYGTHGRPLISCAQFLSCSDGAIRIPCFVVTEDLSQYRILVLIGRQIQGNVMAWNWGGFVPLPLTFPQALPNEHSICELSDGRLATVFRIDVSSSVPHPLRKYVSFSYDGGMTWSESQPLCYTDGQEVCTPNSCGQLLRHSSGKLFYVTNILEDGTVLNTRQSLSIAEVEEHSLRLKGETVTPIDKCQAGECADLAISNFTCYEERNTHQIVVLAPRAFAHRVAYEDCVLMRYDISLASWL